MSNPEHKHELFELSQKVVLYDPMQKKFLVAKDADTTTEGYSTFGPWDLPGGRVNEGEEDLVESVKRELQEEVGDIEFELSPIVGGCTLRVSSDKANPRKVHHYYLGIYKQGEIVLSEEHSEFRWVTAEEVEQEDEYKPWLKGAIRGAMTHIKAQEGASDALRVLADFENYKKRQAAEAKEFSSHLAKSIVTDLVPVLDNLHAASEHVPAEAKESPWVKGITYIEKQFEDALRNYGVEPIEVKPGDAFNPIEHEAVDQKSEEGKESEHKVEKVLQKGYKVGDRVIKAARVIVS